MGDGSRGRPVWFLVLLLAAGVLAAVVQWTPSSWSVGARFTLAVMGAVAAGAAGSYVSEWINARRVIKAREAAAIAEAEKRRAELKGTHEPVPLGVSVAGLLRPEHGVVDFAGRERELGLLKAWCTDEQACPVRLVIGRGGVGKTRLGLRLAELLPFEEWRCQTVADGREVAAVQAAGSVRQRVLLLMDYAETRPGLTAMLAEVAAREAVGETGRLRVLLLARQAGEWWTEMDSEPAAVRDLVERAVVMELAATLDAERDDVQVIEEALPFFAIARGRPVPQMSFTVRSAERLPVLVLHAAALVAVLDDEQGTAGGRAAADLGVLDRLLGHERRLWGQTAQRAGLSVRLPVLEQVIAAAVLLLDPQEGDEELVQQVIRRVPDLKRADGERIGALVGWLRQLYAGAGGLVETLRPDLLAERHATDQLAKQQLLRRSCFTDLVQSQAIQALTVLTRACAHHQDAPGVIDQVLRQDLTGLADAAIVVAVQTGTRLGDLLASVLMDVPADKEDLQRIADAMPYPTVALAAADAAATHRVRELLPVDADPADIARWSNKLAHVLAQVGRREEALEAITEAVTLYRNLAAARPVAFLPDLASALNSQSSHLSSVGRREDALEAITEAVTLYRNLSKTYPDYSILFLPDMATSLSNQSGCLADLGRWEDALEAASEAVQAHRRLAETGPVFLPHLAGDLNNQSSHLSSVGRREDALEAITEAVTLYRNLAEAQPDAFLPGLAMSLSNQSGCLADLGRWEDALEAVSEAVQVRRMLAEVRPDAFLPDLAAALTNQSSHLSSVGRREDALEAITEAVTLYRNLAEAQPDAFLPDLAKSLNNQALRLSDLGRREKALEAATDAVTLFRNLAGARPDAFLSDLAVSLTVMGMALVELDQVNVGSRYLIEGIAIALDRDRMELVSACTDLLRQLHAKDAEAVSSAWRQLIGGDFPA